MMIAAQEDSPRGFEAYFEIMHGSPLHSEGKKWIQRAYEARSHNKGILEKCHRESGKTTVFSKHFMAFQIGHHPEKLFGVIRINDEKAAETTKGIANTIENDPRWKQIFPNVVPDVDRGWGEKGYWVIDKNRADTWAQILTERPDGATLRGFGWKSGSIIGSRFNGMIIIDDIHDRENTGSAKQVNEVVGFYKDTLQYCIMQGCWEIWNFTPWLTNDVYAYAESTGAYEINETPVMLKAKEGDEGAQYWEPELDIPLSGAWWKLYWPEVWGFERIARKYRTTGALDFARMMLLDLEATKGLNLKAEWLHEYPSAQVSASWPVIFGVDYTSTADKLMAKAKDRDYFVLSILRAIPGGGLVLMDGVRAQMSKGEALNTVLSYWAIYPQLQKIGVETHGTGREFYNDLVLMSDVNGRVPPLMEIQHGRRSKGERFENWLAPRFQMSRIWISDTPTPFLNAFKNEWLMWPGAKHDDCLDGVYMGAMAGEGFMPSRTERTFAYENKKPNPFVAFGRR